MSNMIISCGVLLYRVVNGMPEFLLAKPGHPVWKSRDFYSWGLPKGRQEEGESFFETAQREFLEETGIVLPDVEYECLGEFVQPSKKTIVVFAARVDDFNIHGFKSIDQESVDSRTGETVVHPEIERIGWFPVTNVRQYVFFGQKPIVDKLMSVVKV